MLDPFRRPREDEEFWDSDRDEEWEAIKDEVDMDRGEWEYLKNVEDYGLTNEDLDSGDDDDW
jgi:hypothetical protein